ncbi:MAG: FtsX-like permease family protein [Pseudomonadota bacterium]
MEIRPIISTLFRNKTGAILIALQIALTMAVVVNAVVVIQDRAATMAKPTGVDDNHLININVASLADEVDVRAEYEQDLGAIREIPGVQNVAKIETLPLSNSGSATSYHISDDPTSPSTNVAYYRVGYHALETLGVEITRGRWFRQDEVVFDPADGSTPKVTVIADFVAQEMFGDEDPVGKYMYTSLGTGIEIIGTYDLMSRPWYSWGEFYSTVMFPVVERNAPVVVRVDPADRDRMIDTLETTLAEVDQERLVGDAQTLEEVIARTYQRDVAMNRMLTIVMFLVVLITGLGIVGLASFSVMQRRKQIGTRRAIGAQRFHIVRYFLTENWIVTTFGIVLGLCLTFALNALLISEYNLPKLNPVLLPVSVLGLWFVGLAATMGPARTAAGVDPAIATRSI